MSDGRMTDPSTTGGLLIGSQNESRIAALLQRLTLLLMLLANGTIAQAQTAPEIGYLFPPGGRSGTTSTLTVGGYDWTPDMQLFPHPAGVSLTLEGAPGPVLVPDPPYWFGSKARGPAWPLSREFGGKLTVPAGLPRGVYRWQVANANGASPVALFHVTDTVEFVESDAARFDPPAELPPLPVTVSGQIRRIEEIDRYQFQVPKTGPVTIELIARQINSPLHGRLQIQNSQKQVLLDRADTEGRDFVASFVAVAGEKYTLSLHDLDYAGDRSYVYRLVLTAAPPVVAMNPPIGGRGTTATVTFFGPGLMTGGMELESISKPITFPATPGLDLWQTVLETPFGAANCTFRLSDLPCVRDQTLPQNGPSRVLTLPALVSGQLQAGPDSGRYRIALKQGTTCRLEAKSGSQILPLDLALAVLTADGKEVAFQDDGPASVDPRLDFMVPADGEYQIVVSENGKRSGSAASVYTLQAALPTPDFAVTLPTQLSVVSGGTANLAVKVQRDGGWTGPITLKASGWPAGVTVPGDLVIPADKVEANWTLTSSAAAAVSAGLVTVIAEGKIGEQMVTHPAGLVVIAAIMKPRCKITPEGLDDVRKVHRGSTYLAPLLVERLEGYQGDVILEMTSKQQRHRQGLASDEFTVPGTATRVEYPIFVPEWMETTKTSRMILNGVTAVPDPTGKMRTLVNRMELRIGILPEGALLKLSHTEGQQSVSPGSTLQIPVTLARAEKFQEAVLLELVPDSRRAGTWKMLPVTAGPQQGTATVTIEVGPDCPTERELELTLRATAKQDGRWLVMSETTVPIRIRKPGSS